MLASHPLKIWHLSTTWLERFRGRWRGLGIPHTLPHRGEGLKSGESLVVKGFHDGSVDEYHPRHTLVFLTDCAHAAPLPEGWRKQPVPGSCLAFAGVLRTPTRVAGVGIRVKYDF